MRFATRFDLALDPATAAAIRAMAGQITVVAAERIADELRKVLTDPRRAHGVRHARRHRLDDAILPELNADDSIIEKLDTGVVSARAWRRGSATATALKPPPSASTESCRTWRRGSNGSIAGATARWTAPTLRPSKLKPLLAHPGHRKLTNLHKARASRIAATKLERYLRAAAARLAAGRTEPAAAPDRRRPGGARAFARPGVQRDSGSVRNAQLDADDRDAGRSGRW